MAEKMTEKEFLIGMKNFFEGIDQIKANLEEEIRKTEQERNDLLHEIELGNLNAVELMRVVIPLRDVLRERRTYKDELAKVMTIKSFTDKYNNKLITGDILQTIKNLTTLEKNNETRKYRPRIIENMKCVEAKDEI
jgi:flagellar hook-associated protein FlgK